jgi:type IX secretion system PorP/SprF family membrane protein
LRKIILKKKSIHIVILLLFLSFITVKGQQLPIFSQYVLNGFILNPAMAGYDGYTSVNTTARQQWLGFKDAPQTVSATYQTRLLQQSHRIINSPIRKKRRLLPSTKGRVGLGAYIINDNNGKFSRTGVQFTYAYHIVMNNHQLSFGLAGKFFQYRIDDNLTYGSGDNDRLMGSGIKYVGYAPDADFGVYWTNTRYFAGGSVSNIFQSAVKIGGEENKILRHYWAMGGYTFQPSFNLEIEPNVLLKTTEQLIPQADLGVKFYYKEDYWAGMAFRTDGSLITLLGFRANGLYVGYAFDLALSSIQRFNYGSHEISISYKMGDSARRYRWLRRY